MKSNIFSTILLIAVIILISFAGKPNAQSLSELQKLNNNKVEFLQNNSLNSSLTK